MIDGKRSLFGMEGSWRASATMYDEETNSVWLQLTGACVSGAREGLRLARLPGVVHTTWERWLSLHPQTTVLEEHPGPLREGDQYLVREGARSGNPYVPPKLRADVRLEDDRLGETDLVLGVEIKTRAIAFPIVRLHLHPVIEAELDGVSATVWYDATSKTAVAFDRHLAGERLTFGMSGPARFQDQETGSTWTMDGRCVSRAEAWRPPRSAAEDAGGVVRLGRRAPCYGSLERGRLLTPVAPGCESSIFRRQGGPAASRPAQRQKPGSSSARSASLGAHEAAVTFVRPEDLPPA